jgi:hypothetical protein
MTTEATPTQMPTYTPASPPRPSAEELRARIPGWGVDLDPADRPSYPKLGDFREQAGAHWDFPERQPGGEDRGRSIEHAFVTPVFGTAQPLHGVSGAIRRLAYQRYSEGRNAHWLLLVLGDRVDTVGSTVGSLFSRHPDNLLTETGIKSELSGHGLASRFGQVRSDWKHHPIDPLVVVGPWLLAGWGAVAVARRLLPGRRSA